MRLCARTVAIVLFASWVASPAVAGTASGSVVVKDKAIKPTVASAYAVRDPGDPLTWVVEIMLSTKPIDTAAALAAMSPHTDVINQDAVKDADYVLLWVRPDGAVSMNATFKEGMTQYMASTDEGLKAELKENTPGRVAGRLFAPTPLKTMDGTTYTVDLTFAADVARLPAGTALPAGGGEAGQAFLAFMKVAHAKQWPAIAAGSSPRALKFFNKDYQTPKENAADTLDMLQAWLPKAVGSSRVDLQACKLEYSIVSPK